MSPKSPADDVTLNQDDPFDARLERTLTWTNVALSVPSDATGDEKIVLHQQSGSIQPRQLSAIMGHSGAGKTSLLNVLSGKILPSGNRKVEGSVRLDGIEIDPTSIQVKRKIAYVAQRDTLLATATPREAIRFSARLRLNSDLSNGDIETLVDRILDEMRLKHVADTMTGGEHFRGLSGGEMRRLSLGIELVVKPSIIFLDEVTSGLDSHNAAAIMEVLKKIANCGAATVLLSIHQPSSRVFHLIDHLILMNHGRCMYQGSVEDVPKYFELRGYQVPHNYNPADWIIDVSQVESMDKLIEAGFFSENTTATEISSHSVSVASDSTMQTICETPERSSRANLWTEMRMQAVRDAKKIVRDSHALKLRFTIVVVASIIISISFLGSAQDSLESISSFQSHLGLIFFLVLNNAVALQIVMLDAIDQRPIFVREFETDHFRMLSYALVKFVIEATTSMLTVSIYLLVVFWGVGLEGRFWYWWLVLYAFNMALTSIGVALAAITKDPRDAKELIPITLLPQILFCGFFVSADKLPDFLQFLQWVFPLTYVFRLLLEEEFGPCLSAFEELENRNDCVHSLVAAVGKANGSFFSMYNDESIFSVAQTGVYRGAKEIGEINARASLMTSLCPLKAEPMKAKFNSITDDNICDITVADVYQGQINPSVVSKGFKDNSFAKFVLGHRLRYTMAGDLHSANIIRHDQYLPEQLAAQFYLPATNKTAIVTDICATLQERCPGSYRRDEYETFDDCLTRMESLPSTTLNSKGLHSIDANDTLCRFMHGNVAKNFDGHCSSVSYFAEKDQPGQERCEHSNNLSIGELFDKGDMALFEDTAIANGLDPELQIVPFVSLNNTAPCAANIQERLVGLDPLLPSNAAVIQTCASYLESQKSTGDRTVQYWLTLTAMMFAVRLLALCFLRRLVSKTSHA